VGHEDRKQSLNFLHCLLFQILNKKSMFAVLHSDINSLKFDLFYLIGQSNSQKG